MKRRIPGRAAWMRHGWWTAHRFLVLRRAAQISILALFLSGPLLGLWIAKGTLAASLVFDALPLTDPFLILQSLAARHWPETTAWLGAGVVVASYLVLGGRSYCSWACPVNPIADAAAWLRRRLGIETSAAIRRETRWFVFGMALVVSMLTGAIAWEFVNPITAIYRAALFGSLVGLVIVAAIFAFDVAVARQGWCGHLCPVGAAYGLIGRATLLRVSARGRARCDDCLDCFAACPEGHVIAPALRQQFGRGPVILSADCTACGRCIDVCPERIFRFTHRFDHRLDERAPATPQARAVQVEPEKV